MPKRCRDEMVPDCNSEQQRERQPRFDHPSPRSEEDVPESDATANSILEDDPIENGYSSDSLFGSSPPAEGCEQCQDCEELFGPDCAQLLPLELPEPEECDDDENEDGEEPRGRGRDYYPGRYPRDSAPSPPDRAERL